MSVTGSRAASSGLKDGKAHGDLRGQAWVTGSRAASSGLKVVKIGPGQTLGNLVTGSRAASSGLKAQQETCASQAHVGSDRE